jgi:cytochrome oxidase Cu insertion factor (SCO1/SenC/PrrC family)
MSRPALSLRARKQARRCVVGALFGLAYVAPGAAAETLLPPDPSKTVGHVIRFDGFVDENGHELDRQAQADTLPWIVSPMYTRCPHTCSAVTAGVRRAIDQSGLTPSEYRVLSFSFDPNETADGLRAFRARLQLPNDWLTLRARDPGTLERTLKALDFRTISMGNGDFDHPNLVAVLAPDMRLAGYLFGVTFSPTELARSVRRARDGVSAVDVWRIHFFLFTVIGFLASVGMFVVLLSRRRARQQASCATASS